MGCQTALKPTVSGEGIGGCARPWPDVSCRASGWCAALPMTRIWASRDSGGGGSRLEWPEPATPEHGDLDTGARSVFEWRMCKMTPSALPLDLGDAHDARRLRQARQEFEDRS
jgi:hypothetical protein